MAETRSREELVGGFLRRHKRAVPYLLLAPGLLWLILFFVVPGFQMFLTSFWSGTLETGYEFALSNISNYTDGPDPALGRSSSGRSSTAGRRPS